MGIQRAQKFCAVCYYFRKFGDSPNRRTAEIFKIRYVLPNLTFFYIISLLSDKQSSAKGPHVPLRRPQVEANVLRKNSGLTSITQAWPQVGSWSSLKILLYSSPMATPRDTQSGQWFLYLLVEINPLSALSVAHYSVPGPHDEGM